MSKNNFSLWKCDKCGLIRTDLNRNYDDFLKIQYSKGYFTGDPSKMAYENYLEDKPYIVRNMIKFLNLVRAYKPTGRLLDVGCAAGFFVELSLSAGYDASGFDVSDYATQEAAKLVGKSRIKTCSIGDSQYPANSFDVITLFDVFEHLSDPMADMKKLATYLKDDGVIVIATGDTGSWTARVMGRRWTFYNPPQHLFFMDKNNFHQMVRKCGLEVVKWARIGKWLSLGYVLHLARTGAESALGGILYILIKLLKLGWWPLFLPLGDNMIAVLRKKL